MHKRFGRIVGLTAALALALACLCGCSADEGTKTVPLTPQVDASALVQEGCLTVGIDTTYAPFAGEASGKIIGIDVDVAAAIADQLGLELKLVDLAGTDADASLANKDVDIVMNLEEVAGANTKATVAATYLYNAPALFMTTPDPTNAGVDITALGDATIVTQAGSLAAWTIQEMYPDSKGVTMVTSFTTVFEALSSGESAYAAADLVRGSYASLSYEGTSAVALLDTPTPVSIGVDASNTVLATAIDSAVETIESNGVLELVLTKWVGSFSAAQMLPSVAANTTVDNKVKAD